jgi:ABC-type bacteriocin/lantibiotic exporter with double-glycine peptidase domain
MFLAFASFLLSILPALVGRAAPASSSGVWLEVPYVKQTEDGCGSASISMVLQYWSAHGGPNSAERASAELIQKQLYSRKARGIFASDMERYFRESGFREFAVRGEWSDLRQHLEQGRPLIISIQPRGKRDAKALLHYVVVTGMDWEREAVFISDPARGKLLRIERQEFEKEWEAARKWMLLAVPLAAN